MSGGRALWYERLQSSINGSRKVYGGNFIQLATVGVDGRPHVRTVVFRGFTETKACKIITNAQSSKMEQIRHNCFGEIAWWFSKSREQFRLSGTIQVVDGQAKDEGMQKLRLDQWKALSDPAREQFYWPKPGSLVPHNAASFKEMAENIPAGGRSQDGQAKILPPPDSFVLLLFVPDSVHYLDLKENYAQQDTFDAQANTWHAAHLVP